MRSHGVVGAVTTRILDRSCLKFDIGLVNAMETFSNSESNPAISDSQSAKLSEGFQLRAKSPRILLAEDDYELRTLIAEALRRRGNCVYEVPDGFQLRARLESWLSHDDGTRCFDVVISDVRMPGLSGFEALSGVARRHPYLPLVLITAFGDDDAYRKAGRLGAVAFFDKPLDIERLCHCVEKILEIPPGEEDADFFSA